MYYILDISGQEPVRIPGLEFNTYDECVFWIENNGDIINYSIEFPK